MKNIIFFAGSHKDNVVFLLNSEYISFTSHMDKHCKAAPCCCFSPQIEGLFLFFPRSLHRGRGRKLLSAVLVFAMLFIIIIKKHNFQRNLCKFPSLHKLEAAPYHALEQLNLFPYSFSCWLSFRWF